VAAWRSSELPAEESLLPLGDLQHCLQKSPCGRLEVIGMLKQISKLTNSKWNGECRAATLMFFRAIDFRTFSKANSSTPSVRKGKTSKDMRVTWSRHTTSNASPAQELAQILLHDVS
jgi:hypothetical protein